MKHLQLFEQFVNENSLPKKFGSEEQFTWKDVEQKSLVSFIGSIKKAKYNMDMKVPDIKRLFIETFDVLTKKFGYEDHQALNVMNSGGGSYIAYHVLNNHEGVDGEMRYSYNPDGRMEEIMLGFQTMSNWRKKAKDFDNGGKIYESVIPNTKHTRHHEQFVNEKRLKRSDLKEVQDLGYDAGISGGTINVNGENPWGDEHNYTFYWDGEAVWCESDVSSGADYNGTVTTPEEFADAMTDTDNWE